MIITIHLLLRLNVCNDLAEAMKALDGKNRSLHEQKQLSRKFALVAVWPGI